VNRWFLLKDVLLTGCGMALMLSQIFARHPSDVLIAGGLALTVPAVAGQVKTLLGSVPTGGGSSPPSPPSPPPLSSAPPGVTGER
jgi:hypothetical protein